VNQNRIQQLRNDGYDDVAEELEEAQALLAEKDAEIASLRGAIKFDNDLCEKQLRASNEALVAAEARSKQVRDIIADVCEGWTLPDVVRKILETIIYSHTDNLTALRQHDKEVKAKALEEAADLD